MPEEDRKTVDAQSDEMRRLKAELKRVTEERDIEKGRGVLCQDVRVRYTLIAELQDQFPVRRLCKALEVQPSGFYAWRLNPESQRSKEDKLLISIWHDKSSAVVPVASVSWDTFWRMNALNKIAPARENPLMRPNITNYHHAYAVQISRNTTVRKPRVLRDRHTKESTSYITSCGNSQQGNIVMRYIQSCFPCDRVPRYREMASNRSRE